MADDQPNPDVHNPVKKCPDKGKLVAEVITYRAGTKKLKQEGFSGVNIKVDGPTKTANQTTGKDGLTPVVGGLDVGGYTLTLEPSASQKEEYDFEHSTITDNKTVECDKTQSYHFEVPYHWLDYEVFYPDKKTFAVGIEYVLRLKKPVKDAKFDPYAKDTGGGKTGDKRVELEKVPVGRYKLDLKLVYDAVWGDPDKDKEVVIDKAIDLKDPGVKGSIEMYDVQALSDKLLAIDVTVVEDDKHQRGLKTSWTATKDNLKNLKSGTIMFRATVGASATWSAPMPVLLKEKYQVVDQAGKKLDTSLELRTSGGAVIKAAAAGGEAEIQRPWNDPVVRIELPEQKGKHIAFEADGAAARSFSMPNK